MKKKYLFKQTNILDFNSEILQKMRKTEGGWSCCECNFMSSKSRVWEHVESKHMNLGGYTCDLCHKYCPTASSLRNHNDRYHKKFSKII